MLMNPENLRRYTFGVLENADQENTAEVLKTLSDLFQWKRCSILHKNNGMRISHRYRCYMILFPLHDQWLIHTLLLSDRYRNL